jgi:hypothetical protein
MSEYDNVIAKAKKAVDDFVSLDVTTIVGKFKLDENGKVVPADDDQKIIYTESNILTGDIRNLIDPEFASAADDPIRKFHESQVDKAEQTISNTIDALKAMVGCLVDLVAARDGTPAAAENTPPAIAAPANS